MSDIPYRAEKNHKFSKKRMAVYTVTWLLTVVVELGFVRQASDKGGDNVTLEISLLAGILLAFLYFLSLWAREVLKNASEDPSTNPLLVCWLSVIGSIIVCLIGVLAFGIRASLIAISISPENVWGVLGWIVPTTYVAFVGIGLVYMLIGMLLWYIKALRPGSELKITDFDDTMLKRCKFMPWRFYLDYAILIFVGMGLVCLVWVISGNQSRLLAALGLIFSLLFGVFGVGFYTATLGQYLPQVRSWYHRLELQKEEANEPDSDDI